MIRRTLGVDGLLQIDLILQPWLHLTREVHSMQQVSLLVHVYASSVSHDFLALCWSSLFKMVSCFLLYLTPSVSHDFLALSWSSLFKMVS